MRWLALSLVVSLISVLVGCSGGSDADNADIKKPGTVEVVPAKPGIKSPEERGAESRAANGRKADEEGEGH